MFTAILCLAAANADPPKSPAASQAELLRTFRSEFVAMTPGRGGFPKSLVMGGGTAKEQQPPHKVTFTRDFSIARYEVTQALWESVMGKNPSRWKGPRNSVEMLSHDEAVDFCRKATTLMRAAKRIGAEQSVRLPTEAEWEYAARAGTDTKYSFGDDPKKLGDFAWFHGNAQGNDPPVGAKKPNRWQLYDTHGYLWEWCADDWHDNYQGAPADGSARTGSEKPRGHVLRGGSWKDPAEKLTSRFRRRAEAGLRDDAVGLRCVLAGKDMDNRDDGTCD